MPSKHFDLALDVNLGGEQASDHYVASQKAVKTYVDKNVPTVSNEYSAESADAMSGIAVASAIENIQSTSVVFRSW